MAPYFISNDSEVTGCPAWGVVKEDGEAVESGCYSDKQDAIDRMVAMSIAEGLPVGGEWPPNE